MDTLPGRRGFPDGNVRRGAPRSDMVHCTRIGSDSDLFICIRTLVSANTGWRLPINARGLFDFGYLPSHIKRCALLGESSDALGSHVAYLRPVGGHIVDTLPGSRGFLVGMCAAVLLRATWSTAPEAAVIRIFSYAPVLLSAPV